MHGQLQRPSNRCVAVQASSKARSMASLYTKGHIQRGTYIRRPRNAGCRSRHHCHTHCSRHRCCRCFETLSLCCPAHACLWPESSPRPDLIMAYGMPWPHAASTSSTAAGLDRQHTELQHNINCCRKAQHIYQTTHMPPMYTTGSMRLRSQRCFQQHGCSAPS
jgi:hypothetical protein